MSSNLENIDALTERLASIRQQLAVVFSPETAAQGFDGSAPSTGHCAAVAIIVREIFGGEMISTLVQGHSHWLNRLTATDTPVDVDLTGDQFGRPPLQIANVGGLYPDTRVRRSAELTQDTLARARSLAHRAGLLDAARSVEEQLEKRAQLSGR